MRLPFPVFSRECKHEIDIAKRKFFNDDLKGAIIRNTNRFW